MQRSEITGKTASGGGERQVPLKAAEHKPLRKQPQKGNLHCDEGTAAAVADGKGAYNSVISFFPLREKPQRRTFRCSSRRRKQYCSEICQSIPFIGRSHASILQSFLEDGS